MVVVVSVEKIGLGCLIKVLFFLKDDLKVSFKVSRFLPKLVVPVCWSVCENSLPLLNCVALCTCPIVCMCEAKGGGGSEEQRLAFTANKKSTGQQVTHTDPPLRTQGK